MKKGIGIIVGVVGTLMVAMMYYMFGLVNVENGQIVITQSKLGDVKVHLNPGVQRKPLFADEFKFDRNIVVLVDTQEAIDAMDKKSRKEINYVLKPEHYLFTDKVNGTPYGTFTFTLPSNEADMKAIYREYPSQESLITRTLRPAVKASLDNSAKMTSMQALIVGDIGRFRSSVIDQLNNGLLVMNTKEVVKDITDVDDKDGERKVTTEIVAEIQKDKNGNNLRQGSAIKDFGIDVSVNIATVDPEDKFKLRLQALRDIAADTAKERDLTKQAVAKKNRVVADGDVELAESQVEENKKLQTERLAIENDKAIREIELDKQIMEQEKAIQLEEKKQELLDKQKQTAIKEKGIEIVKGETKKVKANAQAYEMEKLRKAGLDPKVAAEYRLKEVTAMWENLGKLQTPENVTIMGGANGEGANLADVMMVKMAQDLSKSAPTPTVNKSVN